MRRAHPNTPAAASRGGEPRPDPPRTPPPFASALPVAQDTPTVISGRKTCRLVISAQDGRPRRPYSPETRSLLMGSVPGCMGVGQGLQVGRSAGRESATQTFIDRGLTTSPR